MAFQLGLPLVPDTSYYYPRFYLGLPDKWIPLYNFDDGIMAYLDYSSLNDVGEPCVIAARFNDVGYQIEETIAEDFGEFILQLVKEQLAD